jgi:hypothetical protein
MLIELKMTNACPFCGHWPCLPIRVGDGCREFLCEHCDMRHTRKAGQLDAFAFWPPDIDRALSNRVEPIKL